MSEWSEARNARLERTRARYASLDHPGWHFLMLGPPMSFQETRVGSLGVLRRLEDKPDVFDLAGILEDPSYHGVIAHWAEVATNEFSLDADENKDPNVPLSLGFSTLTLLKIRTKAQFLVPVVADSSWTAMAAAPRNTVRSTLLESNFQARLRGEHREITAEDAAWVGENISIFLSLKSEPRFRMAAEVLGTYHVTGDSRQAAALLWSGLEAIFEASHEITFQISAYIATLLKDRGEQRFAEFNRIKKMYAMRSKVVHGSNVTPDQLDRHVVETYELLADVLMAILIRREVPKREGFSQMLFE